MSDTLKPNFATWDIRNLSKMVHDLWDENKWLRAANEQLRLDNKDLSKLNRELLTKENQDDWK
jgi:hypothetical protein